MFLLLFIVSSVESVPVFHFEQQHSLHSSDLSYATLARNPQPALPERSSTLSLSFSLSLHFLDRFLLCSSHMQQKLDGWGFYQLYGNHGDPWFTIKIVEVKAAAFLWMQMGRVWYKITEIEEFKLYLWYHICLDVDFKSNTVLVAVNEKRMTVDVSLTQLQEKVPNDLKNKFFIGKWKVWIF